jgi:hypothetical protein
MFDEIIHSFISSSSARFTDLDKLNLINIVYGGLLLPRLLLKIMLALKVIKRDFYNLYIRYIEMVLDKDTHVHGDVNRE